MIYEGKNITLLLKTKLHHIDLEIFTAKSKIFNEAVFQP